MVNSSDKKRRFTVEIKRKSRSRIDLRRKGEGKKNRRKRREFHYNMAIFWFVNFSSLYFLETVVSPLKPTGHVMQQPV